MQTHKAQALLVDLGGVVIDIDFDRALRAWQPKSRLSIDELRQAFRFDLAYQRHERGEITSAQYFDHLATVLQIEFDHQHVAEGWNSIYVGIVPDTLAALRAVRSRLPCYAFTNTNASHATTWRKMFPDVVNAFDRIFMSHEMGLRKPEPEAFDRICREIALPPASILFFDDLLENVESARVAGLQAVHVRSPRDVQDALQPLMRYSASEPT